MIRVWAMASAKKIKMQKATRIGLVFIRVGIELGPKDRIWVSTVQHKMPRPSLEAHGESRCLDTGNPRGGPAIAEPGQVLGLQPKFIRIVKFWRSGEDFGVRRSIET